MSAEQLLEVIRLHLESDLGPSLYEASEAAADLKAEIESLRRDAVLGAMVRRMPAGSVLCRYGGDTLSWRMASGGVSRYQSPEAAIRAAMGMEVGERRVEQCDDNETDVQP